MTHHTLRQGQVRSTPSWAKSDDLALDPMQAGLGHRKSGLTLALPTDSVVVTVATVAVVVVSSLCGNSA